MKSKRITVLTPYQRQSCVIGREDINVKIEKETGREYAAMCFAFLAVIIVVYASIGALKWFFSELGIQVSQSIFWLCFCNLWCVVIGSLVWFSCRKAKNAK